jgi:hypothetical protein
MPLVASTMSDAIFAMLIAKPIGTKPVMVPVQTPKPDGTVDVKTTPTALLPVTLDPTLARLIADSVATVVCSQITSAAMVTTVDPISGPLVGKIS